MSWNYIWRLHWTLDVPYKKGWAKKKREYLIGHNCCLLNINRKLCKLLFWHNLGWKWNSNILESSER
jgi:hypothetical protein